MVKAAANGSDLELSDPYRKKIGWVVDVLRDSDKKKMGEISLSVDLLPPRRNKQGKVVWSLPNDVNMVPRLGLNEEKLVFAEYRRLRKEKKDANRERAKSKSSQRSKSAVIEDTINTSNLEEQVKEQAVLCVQTIWRRFQARTLYQTKKNDSKQSSLVDDIFSVQEEEISSVRVSLSTDPSKPEDASTINAVSLTPPRKEDQLAPHESNDEDTLLLALSAISSRCGNTADKLRWTSTFKLAVVERLDELAEVAWQHATSEHVPETSNPATINSNNLTSNNEPPPSSGWSLNDVHSREPFASPIPPPPGLLSMSATSNLRSTQQAINPPPGLVQATAPSPPPGLGALLVKEKELLNLYPSPPPVPPSFPPPGLEHNHSSFGVKNNEDTIMFNQQGTSSSPFFHGFGGLKLIT